MQVDTSNNSTWPLLGTASTATGNTAGGTTGAAGGTGGTISLFGPAAILALGQGGSTVLGYTDLVAPLPTLPNSLPIIWQFDLASVLNPGAATLPTSPRSEEQQEAEDAAVKEAFDLINAGETDQARELMDNLLEKNKTNAAAVQALGQAELADGHYAKAQQLFLKAHVLDPSAGYDQDAANAQVLQEDDHTVLDRARVMVATSLRRADGIRLLINLTQRSPENAEAHMLLADSMALEGDDANSLLEYHTAIRTADASQLSQISTKLHELADRYPQAAYVRQLIGKVEMRQERYADAVQTLTAANQLSGDLPMYKDDLAKAYVGLGRQQLADGDLSRALGALRQAKDLSPTSSYVKEALAEGYIAEAELRRRQLDTSAALADYQQAAALLGKTGSESLRERAASGAYALGLQLQRRRIAAGEDIDGEVAAFQAAYDLNSDSDSDTYRHKLAETRAAMGDQYLANQDYQGAAYAYQRAYELDKYDKTYKQQTIDAFVAWGDQQALGLAYNSMIEAYGAAYELDTFNVANKQKLADAYNARGLDYIALGKLKPALADFAEAHHLFPDNTDYLANYYAAGGIDG